MESDGFVLVKSKRKTRKKDSCKAKGVTLCQDGWTSATADKIDRSTSLVPVEDSEIVAQLESILAARCIKEVVCYGIGRLGSSAAAQHQYALLANIISLGRRCYLSEPVLGEGEKEYISKRMSMMEDNDMCCRRVVETTLFYMIHSSKRMYDNVLASNWDQLDKCVMVGNSLQNYVTNNSNEVLRRQAPHILEASEHCSETPVARYNGFPDVFNDTFIITFKESVTTEEVFRRTLPVDKSVDDLEIIGGT